jgi:hypothetical protein
VRNNSATTSFTVQAGLITSGRISAIGPIVAIDTSSLNPRLVFLGIMSVRAAIQQVVIASTASAAAGTLDYDYICIQAIDDECSGAVAISTVGAALGGVAAFGPGADPAVIAPVALLLPTPSVASGGVASAYAGDAYPMSRGQSYAAVWLATSGTFWRTVNASNALMDTAFTASRNNGYLSPR